jgi:hypothetical protein
MKISDKAELMKQIAPDRLIPIKGIVGALFMLVLSLIYHNQATFLIGTDNDVYKEYSTILFYAGLVFLLYSAAVAWVRIFRRSQ